MVWQRGQYMKTNQEKKTIRIEENKNKSIDLAKIYGDEKERVGKMSPQEIAALSYFPKNTPTSKGGEMNWS